VWARCLAPPAAGPAPRAGGRARCWAVDGGLPPGLLARLSAAFAPGAGYWGAHRYHDLATPFFSYVFPLPPLEAEGGSSGSSEAGGERGAPPATALEAAARLLRRRCAAAVEAGCGGVDADASALAGVLGATHVEFWAHTRGPEAPHQLHFDGGRRQG
jgi:hypothetical protein